MPLESFFDPGSDLSVERLLEARVVSISGLLDDDSTANIIAQLLFLKSRNATKPVQLRITSMGGFVNEGLAIRDCIKSLPFPVKTYAMGRIFGMATLVLAAGALGRLLALNHCRIGLGPLQFSDSWIDPTAAEQLTASVKRMFAADTGQSEYWVNETFAQEQWFSAQEAIKRGIADAVAERF